MGSEPIKTNPEIEKYEEPSLSRGTSRETIAQKLGLKVEDIPVMASYEKIQGMLGELEGEVTGKKGEARVVALRDRLKQISLSETADRAKELGQKATDALPKLPGAAEVVGKIAKEAGASGEKVMKAVSSGNIQDVGRELSEASDKGSGFLSKAGNVVSSLLAWLWSFLTFSGDSGKNWDEFMDSIGLGTAKKVDEAKKKAQEMVGGVPGKVGEAKEALSDKQKLGEQFWKSFSESGWIKDPKGKKDDFMKVFGEYSEEFIKATGETAGDIKDNKDWNWMDRFVKYPMLSTKFILALVAKNVIPKEAIAVHMYDTGRASLRMYLLSPYTLISHSASKPLADMGLLDASSLSQFNSVEKQAMIGLMHHTMAPQLHLAGKLTSGLAKISLLGLYWDQGTGFTKLRAGTDAVLGEITKSAQHFDELIEMLGDNNARKEFSEYTKDIRSIVSEAKFKAEVAYIFREMEQAGKSSIEIAQRIEKVSETYPELKTTISDLLQKLRTSGDITAARGYVSSYLKTAESGLTPFQRLQGSIRNNFTPFSASKENLDYFKQNSRAMLGRYGESLAQVVKGQHIPIISLYNKLKLGVTQAEFIDAIEKGHLPLKVSNASDAKGALQQLLKNVPKGFEHLFSGVTVWLTVEHVVSTQEGEKLQTAMLDIAAMNPIFGGIMLMYEGATMKGGVPQKLGLFAGGGIVTALGAKTLASLIAERGLVSGVGQFAISPLTSLYQTGTAIARAPQYLYQFGRFGTTAEGLAGISGMRNVGLLGRARPIGILGAGLVLSYLIMNEIFEKETQEVMKKAGFFKENGELDTEPSHLKSAWSKVPVSEQPKIIEKMLSAMTGDVVKFDQANNTLNIHTQPGQSGLPISIDSLDSLFRTFSDLGIKEPKVYMSQSTTDAVKKAISELPVSEEKRQEFLKKFIG